jgi:histidinol-phosphatase
MHTLEDDFALALRMADAAATRSLSYFRRDLRQWNKGDGSLATEADVAVEDELRALLASVRPDDSVLGEERGRTGAGDRCWIVDGIDGTVDFAAGRPDWGTLIALECDGSVVLGVCDQPALKRRYWAVRGGGAFCSQDGSSGPARLRTSSHPDFATARSYVPPPQWTPDRSSQEVANALAAATKPESHVDHPALQVARGTYEFAVFFMVGPWDVAAPSLIVEEAGGRFSDLAGQHRLTSGNAVFSNGPVHGHVIALATPQR